MTLRSTLSLLTLVSVSSLPATPLPMEPLPVAEAWFLPGGEQGALLQPGQEVVTSISVPALGVKDQTVPEGWRGIVSLDLYGTVGSGKGQITLQAIEPASGEVFASSQAQVAGDAPREAWSVISSSGHPGAMAENAFDGDPETGWHSNYDGGRTLGPHWLGLNFSAPQTIAGVSYAPQLTGFNGIAKEYRVEVKRPGEDWAMVTEGTTDKSSIDGKREPLGVTFDQPMAVTAFRFVVVSDWSGGGFGTASEVTPLGLELPEKISNPVPAKARIWLEVPEELMTALVNNRFGLRVTATGESAVIVGKPALSRINAKPTDKLFGRSNGGVGPDKLGAGLLGFDGMTEHQQTVLSVLNVRSATPASSAGLKVGDAIVAVGGQPLPLNNLDPGWEWFEHSHESFLGRATEAALSKGRSALIVTVLREGKTKNLTLSLDRKRTFTSMNPANDPEAAALLEDMLDWVEDNQSENGSWSNDIKRTTFGALALLATGEKKHQRAAGRAVDWAIEQFPEPERHGNLGFWSAGYMMTLFGEWYLHTGDKRVLEPIAEARDWAVAGQHKCKWGMPALGHGPSGLPYDEKSLVAPAIHLLVGESLTKRCGVESKVWELLMPYMEHSWSDPTEGGHGGMGYNASYKDLGEFWSRSGQFAIAAHLRGERSDMRDGMTALMRERHAWIRNSHAYGEPGGGWGLLGLNLAAPEHYAEVIEEYAWWFSLAWEPRYGLRFTTPHMGAPYMGEDDLLNCVYALVLQAPKKSLYLTGLESSE